MYNTQYLPESFEQCGLEKTILQAFSMEREPAFQLDALIQDGGQNNERVYTKAGEIKYFDKNLYCTVPIRVCHPSSVFFSTLPFFA